jgi:O-antigen ligase
MQLENVCVQPLIASRTTKIISIILVFVAFSLPLSTSITNVLLSFFLLLWIIEGKFNEKIIYIWENKAFFASIILLASLVIGSLYSIASWHDILFYLKKMSKLIYLPFLIYYFKDPKQRTWTINAFIVAGMLTVITGITYCVTNQYNEVNPFKNTIDTSLVTTITTFLLMHKICINNKLYLKSILILCILTNVFYLFYISLGRTSQLIFLCLIAVFFIQKIKSCNKLLSLIMIIILTIALGYCGLISNRLHKNWLNVIHYYNNYKLNSFNYEQNSISQRLDYYKNTLLLIKEKPLFGWGT